MALENKNDISLYLLTYLLARLGLSVQFSCSVCTGYCMYTLGKKAKTTKAPETPPSRPAPLTTPRRLPAMYGWAVQPSCPEKLPSVATTPVQSRATSAAPSNKQPTSVRTSSVGVTMTSAAGESAEDLCQQRRQHRDKPRVRYAPPTNCQFVNCGPTKPLRTFREKPDSCLPRRK